MKIILTGVGKGFGRIYLEHIVNSHDVQVCGITRSLDDFADDDISYLSDRGVRLVELNLSNLKDLKYFIKSEEALFKEASVLINNAGQRYRRELNAISETELEELFRINVIAPFILSQACANGMKKRKNGKIINISSILGKSGLNSLSGYAATKGAIDSMTRSLAVELAPYSIQVNAIAPGFCKTSYYESFVSKVELHREITNKIPMKRWGEPDELNGLLDFLIFGKSEYINGQVLYIDGGWTAQ